MPKTESEIKVRELKPSDWAMVEELFGRRGACGGCWCMHWRREKGGQAWEAVKGAPNRKAFKKLVENGEAHGIMAFDGTRPVGWCSFGRRSEFPRLDRVKAFRLERPGEPPTDQIWSINCLYVKKDYRNCGLSEQMVAEAINAIRRRKGKIIEAYPVTLTKDGRQLPAAFAYTGPEIIYQRLGFKEHQRLATTRPLYRLEIRRG